MFCLCMGRVDSSHGIEKQGQGCRLYHHHHYSLSDKHQTNSKSLTVHTGQPGTEARTYRCRIAGHPAHCIQA